MTTFSYRHDYGLHTKTFDSNERSWVASDNVVTKEKLRTLTGSQETAIAKTGVDGKPINYCRREMIIGRNPQPLR